MQREIRSRFAVCVLMYSMLLATAAVAGDLVVRPDTLQVGDLELKDNGGSAYIKWNSSGRLYFYNEGNEAFNIYNGNATFDDDLTVEDNLVVYDVLVVGGGVNFQDDLVIFGKMTSSGGYDPPYVLYDPQSRDQIVDRIKVEVPPAKQAGAALFFNKKTKRLETYVASEGKFYDLNGALLKTLPAVVKPDGQYETEYYMDKNTGQVQNIQKRIKSRFVVKEGVEVDKKTGKFISEVTGDQLSREQALEWYVPHRGEYFDTQGHLLRTEPAAQEAIEYVREYRFDEDSGKIKSVKKAIKGRYEIKAGCRFDKTSGEFVEDETGQNVSKEQAVKFVTASDRVQRIRNKSKEASQ